MLFSTFVFNLDQLATVFPCLKAKLGASTFLIIHKWAYFLSSNDYPSQEPLLFLFLSESSEVSYVSTVISVFLLHMRLLGCFSPTVPQSRCYILTSILMPFYANFSVLVELLELS